MNKEEKIRAEIERRKKEVKDQIVEFGTFESDRLGLYDDVEIYDGLLSFIDSMQKEPKECMYSKDNYTDEDRKVLCDGCEEECEFNKKKVSVSKDWSAEFDKILEPYKNSYNYKKLCLILRWWKSNYERWWHWKLNKKEEPASEGQVKESLIFKHEDKTCKENDDSLTQESASKLIFDGNVNKSWYAHPELAFKAGMQEMREQLMAKAVDVTVHSDAGGYPCIPQIELYDYEKDIPLAKEGDKYKVILIKED